jgi:hypothetical protein
MELLSFCKRLLKNNFSVKKQNNLVAFFSFTNLKNFKIKKEIKKEFMPMIYSKTGGKNKSTQTSNDGVLEEFTLGNYKFIARLIHVDATDIKGNTHTIKFISVDDINEDGIGCAIINFDYEKKTALIQSIGNYNNCVLCADRKLEYKVGQILMCIIIKLCRDKSNIDFIELNDMSTLSCMKTYKVTPNIEWDATYKKHCTLNLKIISTLLHGVPYYYKYGFIPTEKPDIKILEHNQKIFAKKPILYSINIDMIIKDNISDKKVLSIYKKYITPLITKLNNKPVCEFIREFMNINPDPYKKSVLCFILCEIYCIIYDVMDYKTYKNTTFIKFT